MTFNHVLLNTFLILEGMRLLMYYKGAKGKVYGNEQQHLYGEIE